MAEAEANEAQTSAQEFQREQLVSAGQAMGLPADARLGPIVDASQLAPSDWPGEVIDLRKR